MCIMDHLSSVVVEAVEVFSSSSLGLIGCSSSHPGSALLLALSAILFSSPLCSALLLALSRLLCSSLIGPDLIVSNGIGTALILVLGSNAGLGNDGDGYD